MLSNFVKKLVSILASLSAAILAVSLVVAATLIVGGYAMTRFLFSVNDSIPNESTSPNKEYICSVFYRDVDATSPITTIVSLRDSKAHFTPSEDHRVLVIRGKHAVTIQWEDSKYLILSVTGPVSDENVFVRKKAWGNIRVGVTIEGDEVDGQ